MLIHTPKLSTLAFVVFATPTTSTSSALIAPLTVLASTTTRSPAFAPSSSANPDPRTTARSPAIGHLPATDHLSPGKPVRSRIVADRQCAHRVTFEPHACTEKRTWRPGTDWRLAQQLHESWRHRARLIARPIKVILRVTLRAQQDVSRDGVLLASNDVLI